MTTPLTFGRWLKRLRAEQDLTQEMLSELAGCATPTLRSFEIGKRRPSRDMAERIADVLKVPADQRSEFLRLARLPVESQTDVAVVAASNGAVAAAPNPVQPQAPKEEKRTSLIALPQTTNVLIGREAEGNALQQMLLEERSRLVTLIGVGGMGKTRLALQSAQALASQLPHGVAFVALTPLQSAQHLSAALADALGITLQGSSAADEQVFDWLADRHMLLILDNFEHLLTDNGAIVWLKELLNRAPALQLLVTSRERLRISGERVFELSGLSLPNSTTAPETSEAVMLFLERAQRAQSDFTLNSSNRTAIFQICDLVGGMPLGIELAAAWVRVLSTEEIAEELARNIDFLAFADRDAPVRHRSMRAVFDHSWKLLSEQERSALMGLALFRGGCTREAAEKVAGATLPLLASLIDKSLLRRNAVGSAARFDLHELIRHYAADHLQSQGEIRTLQERHAQYFAGLIEQIEARLAANDVLDWRRMIAVEQENLRAALHFTLTERGDVELGLRLAARMGRYWCESDVWKEGRDWLNLALSLAQAQGEPRARALVALGELHQLLGDLAQSQQWLLDGLARWRTLGDKSNVAWALLQLGKTLATGGDYVGADRYLSESLALYRELGNTRRVATLLGQLGGLAIEQGDYARAAALLEEALPSVRATNRPRPLAVTLNLLGRALLGNGDVARALLLFAEALDLFEREESQTGVVWALLNLGLAERAAGNLAQAARHYRRCFQLNLQLERAGGMMAALEGLASIAAAEGHAKRAVTLLSAAQALRTRSGQVLSLYEVDIQQQSIATAKAALSAAEWHTAWSKGAALSPQQVAALVSETGSS